MTAAKKPDSTERHSFVPSGFFVLRSPLLPLDELVAWSDGLEAPAALDDPAQIEQALAADRRALRARLVVALTRPEVREAIFVASPSLDESFDLWLREPDSERGQRVERSLVRYFARMAGRPTPFGLFASCSVGALSTHTSLGIGDIKSSHRHTCLDYDYLFALANALARDPSFRNLFVYRPNSSLYRYAGRVRYVEARLDGVTRLYHLIATEVTAALEATLTRAATGATLESLAAALVDDDVSQAEAEQYVNELIESQILVPDLSLPVTGVEPVHSLIEQLSTNAETRSIAERLAETDRMVSAIDSAALGVTAERYREVARHLEALPAKVELSRLFQVDLVKPAPDATLGAAVVRELLAGVALLHRIARPRHHESLRRFREAFLSRYESREIPLTEALDEEAGIGFGAADNTSPLLRGLDFPPVPDEMIPWGSRESVLLRKLSEALSDGHKEIALGPSDLEEMAAKDPPPLPNAFDVIATVTAPSESGLARGDFRILLYGTSGPSGARLLGRFCHGDETLRAHVERHLRGEEALEPEAILAEIVHLPPGRLGNLLLRPVLREYEIPYLGRSGAPADRQIPITDLLVSVTGEEVVLRSARLGRRVIPRLTSPHNWDWGSLGIYRFLCALQSQGVAGQLGWDWGVLRNAAYLPRIVTGRLVLSRARWRAGQEDLRELGRHKGAACYQAVQGWRRARRLPRWIALADYDNLLPVDLDNALSVESFVHLVRERDEAVLVELFPWAGELCARGPEGSFVHELVVPFVRAPGQKEASPKRTRSTAPGRSSNTGMQFQRSFPPGSEWLYAKLYTGIATTDEVLRAIAPVARDAVRRGAADQWFFVRYGDPDWHLRLRVHGAPEGLNETVWPSLQTVLAPLVAEGIVWRVTLDTYEREVERYGGTEGIALAERLFHADSEAALEIIELLEPGDAGLDERWRLTLRGVDQLLWDLGFELDVKTSVVEASRDAFAKELGADLNLRRQLGKKFRKERATLRQLLDPGGDAESLLEPGIEALRRRSERMRPVAAALRACEEAGRLLIPLRNIATSYLHMQVNRFLRSAHRQELVLYDLLARHYSACVHHAGEHRPDQRPARH